MPEQSDQQHPSEAVEAEEPSEPIDLGEPDLVLRQQDPPRDSRDWWKAIQQQIEQGDRDTNPG